MKPNVHTREHSFCVGDNVMINNKFESKVYGKIYQVWMERGLRGANL